MSIRTDLIGETVLIANPNYDPMKDGAEFIEAKIRAIYPSFSTSPTPFAIIEHEHGELQINVKVEDLKVKKDIQEEDAGFQSVPVMYFSQLLAFAYGISPEIHDYSLHHIDPRPLLQERGLL